MQIRHPLVAMLALLTLGFAQAAHADQEVSNVPYVQSSTYGRCYAKAVPADLWDERGVTRLYQVGPDDDRLLATYPWFSLRLRLQCNLSRNGEIGGSLVRFGRWPRGHSAKAEDLALAFYFNDELLAEYSTLDLAKRPDNVEISSSHYTIIDQVEGYRRLHGNDWAFVIVTTDGRTLAFNPKTGKRRALPAE